MDSGGVERRDRRIEAFAPAYRPAIAELAATSSRLEDLADSFPAMLFALATGFGTPQARTSGIGAVMAGRPLRVAADQLGLPFWLRKLPAHAFQAPIARAPGEPALANRLVSLIPRQPSAIGPWLGRVLTAHHTGLPELTLWTAQHYRGATPAPASEAFLRVLAWAWYSRSKGTRAGELMGVRWSPTAGLRRASKEAALWHERLALDVCLGAGLRDSWLVEGPAAGFEFTALRTAEDFIAEAIAMDNCLDRYADRLAGRAVRVFSIRRDGRSVANVEIAAHEREPGIPSIAQLRAARNRRAPMEIWQAAFAWLGSQPVRMAEPRLQIKTSRAARRKRLELLWRPFLDVLPPTTRLELEAALIPGGPIESAHRGEADPSRAPSPVQARRSPPARS